MTSMAAKSKYQQKTDEELVGLIKQEDQAAISEFYYRKSDPLFYISYKIIKDKEQALATVLKAYESLLKLKENLNTVSDFNAMWYTITYRKTLSLTQRRSGSRQEILLEDFNMFAHRVEEDDALANLINSAEINQQLYIAINKLPQRQRQVVNCMLDNKTTAEIGHEMAINPSTVRQLWHTAILNLKKHFKAERLVSVVLMGILAIASLVFKLFRI